MIKLHLPAWLGRKDGTSSEYCHDAGHNSPIEVMVTEQRAVLLPTQAGFEQF
jgi:hypothetical protein